MKSPVKSVWITANAGSGKTTELTARVVRLLLLGVPPERIVCITYTKAAASEMRERIMKRLRELLLMEDAACAAKVAEYVESAATPEQLTRARQLFATVLDSPEGGLQLTTIHGFCQNLLRRFPLESGIAPHITVLEDAAAEEVARRAKHAVLDLESADPALTEALALIGTRGGEWHFEAMCDDILSKRRHWQPVLYGETAESLRTRIFAAHGVDENASDEMLAASVAGCLSAEMLTEIRSALPMLATHKTQKYREWGRVLERWQAPCVDVGRNPTSRGEYPLPLGERDGEGLTQPPVPESALIPPFPRGGKEHSPRDIDLAPPQGGSYGVRYTHADTSAALCCVNALAPLCKLFIKDDGAIKANLFNKTDFPEGSPFRVALMGLIESLSRYHAARVALVAAEESLAVAHVAETLLRVYEAEKLARQALDYDDLIIRTLQLLAHPSMLGWVMQKLDHRIDHLLIDEAQDNSGEQWQLAHLLVEELMASTEGVGAGGLPRSLLVVGDEKQSIYSFQGAAPEQFAAYHARFTALLAGRSSALEPRALTKSYRSAEAVLTLVDQVAALPEVAPALSATGEQAGHVLHHVDAAGLVRLYAPMPAPEGESPPPLTIPTEYKVTQGVSQQLAMQIAAQIHQWLHMEKRMLESEGRPLRAGDILILVHRRRPMVMPLLRALQAQGVAVAGIDRLTLSEHLAVRDLLALIQWCLNPADDLALAQVLRSPLVGMSDEALRKHAYGRAGSLWHRIDHPWLASLLMKRGQTPYAFLTHVLEVSDTRRALARRFGEEVHEVLDELLAQAAAMPTGMSETLPMFHDWMSKNTRQIKREQEAASADQVRIMTVHGAKGLEAPVVILADTVSVPTTQHERSYMHAGQVGKPIPVLAISSLAKSSPLLTAAKERKKQQLTHEYYRLLYVALTRAKYELHVFGSSNAKGEVKAGSWYALVDAALRQLPTREAEGVLELRDERPVVAVRGVTEKFTEAFRSMPAWVSQPATPEGALTASLAPSRLEGATPKPYAMQASADTRQRGVRIHRILELLPANADEVLIARIAAHVAPEWEEGARNEAVAEVARLYSQEAWLWHHPRAAEASVAGTITHEGAKIPVSGQVDLLVHTPEAVVIVDYKTGREVPASAAEVPPNYILQLKLYAELLKQIYPQKPIRCAILWTRAPSLMWVDEAVTAMHFPALQSAVKPTVAA